MSWADTMKAMALAALAERNATVGRILVDAPSGWNPHDVWLTRVKQPRELAAQSSRSGKTTPPALSRHSPTAPATRSRP
jgi:hypothetical protein